MEAGPLFPAPAGDLIADGLARHICVHLQVYTREPGSRLGAASNLRLPGQLLKESGTIPTVRSFSILLLSRPIYTPLTTDVPLYTSSIEIDDVILIQ